MDAFDALQGRRSIRVFSDEDAFQESIEQILDTARLAPTATVPLKKCCFTRCLCNHVLLHECSLYRLPYSA